MTETQIILELYILTGFGLHEVFVKTTTIFTSLSIMPLSTIRLHKQRKKEHTDTFQDLLNLKDSGEKNV